MNIKFTPLAEEDLESIYHYSYQQWGVHQADKYIDRLYHDIEQKICEYDLGRHFPYSKKGYRFITSQKHFVFYRYEKNDVIIIRILNKVMNMGDHL